MTVKLLLQPGDGIDRLVKGIRKARKSVEILIFRFDHGEIERALVEAAERGIFVHALIAFTNRGGEEHLRRLEMRMLENGISVARTAGDLVRYHGKMMIVDRKELYLLSFNFTHLDIDHSRSFGVMTRNPDLVREAVRLFEADTKRQPYVAGHSKFLVSPVNAREQLTSYIKGARKQLLIYDPQISDGPILRILHERMDSGVDVRVIGKVSRSRLQVRPLTAMRLHARAILRDRQQAFVGSPSLRHLELDSRREIGAIFRDRAVVNNLVHAFEQDWKVSKPPRDVRLSRGFPVGKAAKKVAKAVTRNLPMTPVVSQITRAIRKKGKSALTSRRIEKTVQTAVQQAFKGAVKAAAKEAITTIIEEPTVKREDNAK